MYHLKEQSHLKNVSSQYNGIYILAEEVIGKGRFAYVTGLDRYLVSLLLCILIEIYLKNSTEKPNHS